MAVRLAAAALSSSRTSCPAPSSSSPCGANARWQACSSSFASCTDADSCAPAALLHGGKLPDGTELFVGVRSSRSCACLKSSASLCANLCNASNDRSAAIRSLMSLSYFLLIENGIGLGYIRGLVFDERRLWLMRWGLHGDNRLTVV